MEQSHAGILSRSVYKQDMKGLTRWGWFLAKGHSHQLLPNKEMELGAQNIYSEL